MSVEKQRAILDAYDRGEVIEWRMRKDEFWTYSASKEMYGEDYGFDFVHCEYRVKRPRWRALVAGEYYFVNTYGEVKKGTEINGEVDDQLYKIGNYFRTEELAKEASEAMLKCVTNLHECHASE